MDRKRGVPRYVNGERCNCLLKVLDVREMKHVEDDIKAACYDVLYMSGLLPADSPQNWMEYADGRYWRRRGLPPATKRWEIAFDFLFGGETILRPPVAERIAGMHLPDYDVEIIESSMDEIENAALQHVERTSDDRSRIEEIVATMDGAWQSWEKWKRRCIQPISTRDRWIF